jgi:hypothetical protein
VQGLRIRMSQNDKISMLRHAIENSKPVRAVIRDLSRVFCPHILGTMNERRSIVAWQFDGYSTIGDLPNWRRFDLDEISSMQVIDGPWHQGFKRSHHTKKFEFDSVDAIADSEHLGTISAVSPIDQRWHSWLQSSIHPLR